MLPVRAVLLTIECQNNMSVRGLAYKVKADVTVRFKHCVSCSACEQRITGRLEAVR